jgi:hypothetical protein
MAEAKGDAIFYRLPPIICISRFRRHRRPRPQILQHPRHRRRPCRFAAVFRKKKLKTSKR